MLIAAHGRLFCCSQPIPMCTGIKAFQLSPLRTARTLPSGSWAANSPEVFRPVRSIDGPPQKVGERLQHELLALTKLPDPASHIRTKHQDAPQSSHDLPLRLVGVDANVEELEVHLVFLMQVPPQPLKVFPAHQPRSQRSAVLHCCFVSPPSGKSREKGGNNQLGEMSKGWICRKESLLNWSAWKGAKNDWWKWAITEKRVQF